MNELILATSNKGKLTELQALLSPIKCISQQTLGISDADETGLSFIENAIIKARNASRLGNKPALADDSGLVVPSLGGQPGIYSARYSGNNSTDKTNIDLLLKRLESHTDNNRQAFFFCAIALVQYADDPTPIIATGRLDGLITHLPQGEHGFGYDPVFYIPALNQTLAQIPRNIKNDISHRAAALKQLLKQL